MFYQPLILLGVLKICLQAKLKCLADHEVSKLLALWLYASELFLNNSCSDEHGYSQYYSIECLAINGNNFFLTKFKAHSHTPRRCL
jgi:hypothetical protein